MSKTKRIKFNPTSNRLLVKQHEEESKTAAGIIIPDNAKEKLMKGTVIAAGPGEHDQPNAIKVKDEIMFGQYAGTDIILNGEKYLIMRENDAWGTVEYEENTEDHHE